MLEMGTSVWFEQLAGGGAFMVMRGFAALCAYLGIPREHPAAGSHYDDLLKASDSEIPIHFGLNFAAFGDGNFRSPRYYWIGWDYGHFCDRTFLDLTPEVIDVRRKLGHPLFRLGEREWLLPDVLKDARQAIEEFDKAIREWRQNVYAPTLDEVP